MLPIEHRVWSYEVPVQCPHCIGCSITAGRIVRDDYQAYTQCSCGWNNKKIAILVTTEQYAKLEPLLKEVLNGP